VFADVVAGDVQSAELIYTTSDADPLVDFQAGIGPEHGHLFVRVPFDGAAVRSYHSDVARLRHRLDELPCREDVSCCRHGRRRRCACEEPIRIAHADRGLGEITIRENGRHRDDRM
jgi:hypothetical protein